MIQFLGMAPVTKALGAVMVIAAVVGGIYISVQKHTISSLRQEVAKITAERNNLIVDNSILKENNATLKDGLRKLAIANQTNFETARQLLDERSKAQTAINNLAIANAQSRRSLERLNARIEEMLKDPKNDGPVAPVLREVIREIQKERAR